MMNKKGVSAVIANVLIVLLVVAAVSILWAVIKPTLESAGDDISGSTTCGQVNMEITKCESNGTLANITVFRKAGGPDSGTAIVSVEGMGAPCEGLDGKFEVLASEVVVCNYNASGQTIRAGMILDSGKVCEGIAVEFTCP